MSTTQEDEGFDHPTALVFAEHWFLTGVEADRRMVQGISASIRAPNALVLEVRSQDLREARETLPTTFEGYPVVVRAIPPRTRRTCWVCPQL